MARSSVWRRWRPQPIGDRSSGTGVVRSDSQSLSLYGIRIQALFDRGHRGVVMLGDRPGVHLCIDQGRVQSPVDRELLDRGCAAAGVQEPGGEGVAEGVERARAPCRWDCDPASC